MASALSRWQSERGPRVSTLRHGVLKVEDPICRELLRLLDGTQDRAELQRRLEPLVAVATATPEGAKNDRRQAAVTSSAHPFDAL